MNAPEYRRIVAVDFDGTLAKTRFPEIIEPIPKTVKYCRQLQKDGAILILWTCRKGKDLQDAVEWCAGQGLTFDYVNENTAGNIAYYGEDTRKVSAHEYIDDKAVNPVREEMWERRLRQALWGHGREAAICSLIGGATAFILQAVILFILSALKNT